MQEIAIVILNYNGAHHLQKFLPSVVQHSTNAGIYVIDNASSDHSLSIINQFPGIKVIQLTQNYGFAEGYNLGLKEISSKYYVLLNSDIEVTSNWLDPMHQFLENQQEYVLCQPKVLDYNYKDHFEYAGAAGGFLDMFGYPFCRGRIFETLENDHGQYNSPTDVFWTSGACFMIRTETFQKYGGFDKDFFAHMEEIDLCWRIFSHGLKAICLPQSTVYHVGGGTLQYGSTHKTYLNFRNGLILLLKNLPIWRLSYVLPVRIFLDIIAGIRLAKWSQFQAILKAHIHFYASFVTHFRKRSTCRAPGKALKGDKILVIQYFIRKKRCFSEIQ